MSVFARWVGLAVAGAAAFAAQAADEASDTVRRDQLNGERTAAQTRYEQTVRECERGFAVTSCVNQAKAERRATMDRIAREQAVLDDEQRKRRAEERRQRIAQKQAQQSLQAQQAAAASAAAAAAPQVHVRTPPASAAKPGRRFEPRTSAAAAAAEAEAADRAAESQERRERAQAHEEAVRKRNDERAAQRAPAAPLPVPSAPMAPAQGASAASRPLR